MAYPVQYKFSLHEDISENFLSRLLSFYQNFMHEVMRPNDLESEIKKFTDDIRKWFPKCVFDHHPESGTLIDDLRLISDLGDTKFIYWYFVLPFRFQVEVKKDYQVEISFFLELTFLPDHMDVMFHMEFRLMYWKVNVLMRMFIKIMKISTIRFKKHLRRK